MKRLIAVMTGIMAFALLVSSPVNAAENTPTFNQDVGQIVFDNCSSCHRENQIAPMSLMSFEETRPWARAIKAKVVSREMPPWFADPQYGEFSNDISLSDDEIATIVAWADGGAPEGHGPAPDAPNFSADGWGHPSGLDPDYVIEFPVTWHVQADGEMPNFNVYQPLPFNDKMSVSATQVRPGNYAATHHITTALANIPEGMKVGRGPAWPGGPMFDYALIPDPDAAADKSAAEVAAELADDGEGLTRRTRSGTLTSGRGVPRETSDEAAKVTEQERRELARARGGFGPYIPGVAADVAKPGQGREIRGDLFDHIVWNMHYQSTGQPETARPSIGAWFANDEITTYQQTLSTNEYTSESEQLIAPAPRTREERLAAGELPLQIAQNINPLLAPIPPNAANWTVTGIGAFQNDSIIQSLFIHAHLRGKDFTYVLTYPDGREEILLRVPNYQFDWQFEYELTQPLKVPAGSTLKTIARYDNSRANRSNPAPDKETYWSEQSWDDMFLTNAKYILDGEEANDN